MTATPTADAAAAAAPTVRALLDAAAERLAAAGVDAPRRDARLLLAAALATDTAALLAHVDRRVDAAAAARFSGSIDRRAAREPVSRILGTREFWSLSFRLTPATLDPRPDSETLIEAAFGGIADRQAPLRLLDLGTGSGCLLLALLSELPNATGIGVDRDPAAVAAAAANAEALGFAARAAFQVGDWAAGLAGPFDLVVSNPPYVPAGEIDLLAPEVARFEPRAALEGGADGLDAYRALAPEIARLLRDGGRAVLELGAGQHAAVAAILGAAGLEIRGFRNDLNGILRCVVATRDSAKIVVGKPRNPD
jgi:release factor glutamine methyltransferase